MMRAKGGRGLFGIVISAMLVAAVLGGLIGCAQAPAPETTAPETTAPETTAPETTAPETT